MWSTEIDPVKHAIQGASITDRVALDRLLASELSSLDAFTRGVAQMSDWIVLVNLNNITQCLASLGVGMEAMPDAHKAEEGLIDAARRFQDTGKMGLTGPAIQALRDVIEWHDLQRSSIPRSKYEEAIRLTAARVKSGYKTTDIAELLKD